MLSDTRYRCIFVLLLTIHLLHQTLKMSMHFLLLLKLALLLALFESENISLDVLGMTIFGYLLQLLTLMLGSNLLIKISLGLKLLHLFLALLLLFILSLFLS